MHIQRILTQPIGLQVSDLGKSYSSYRFHCILSHLNWRGRLHAKLPFTSFRQNAVVFALCLFTGPKTDRGREKISFLGFSCSTTRDLAHTHTHSHLVKPLHLGSDWYDDIIYIISIYFLGLEIPSSTLESSRSQRPSLMAIDSWSAEAIDSWSAEAVHRGSSAEAI